MVDGYVFATNAFLYDHSGDLQPLAILMFYCSSEFVLMLRTVVTLKGRDKTEVNILKKAFPPPPLTLKLKKTLGKVADFSSQKSKKAAPKTSRNKTFDFIT